MSNDTAIEIKSRVTMADIIRYYGFHVSRGNRIKCPFHHGEDYNLAFGPWGWKCYVCGEGGDIFDFVSKLEGMTWLESAKLIDRMFGLCINFGILTEEEEAPRAEARRRRNAEAEEREKLSKALTEAEDILSLVDRLLIKSSPQRCGEINDYYIYALNMLPQAQFERDLAETRLQLYDKHVQEQNESKRTAKRE